MINYHNLKFSDHYSNQRINLFSKIIGEKTVKKIIAFALYLLGASRNSVAEFFEIPYDTFKSFTERLEQVGLSAIFDRRAKRQTFPESKQRTDQTIQKVVINFQDNYLYINLESGSNLFKIPSDNSIQIKTILLTLLDNKLISRNTVSELLDYTPAHIQRLKQKLQHNDVGLFIDQRQGQQKNYIFNPEIQTELFQQYIANLVTGRSVSSQILSENLTERCNIELSSRTIRYHLNKSGLSKIKKTLPQFIESLKKTPKYID